MPGFGMSISGNTTSRGGNVAPDPMEQRRQKYAELYQAERFAEQEYKRYADTLHSMTRKATPAEMAKLNQLWKSLDEAIVRRANFARQQ